MPARWTAWESVWYPNVATCLQRFALLPCQNPHKCQWLTYGATPLQLRARAATRGAAPAAARSVTVMSAAVAPKKVLMLGEPAGCQPPRSAAYIPRCAALSRTPSCTSIAASILTLYSPHALLIHNQCTMCLSWSLGLSALLPGGTRFIGVYLARQLIEQGHEVTLLTRGKKPVTYRIPDDTGGWVRVREGEPAAAMRQHLAGLLACLCS